MIVSTDVVRSMIESHPNISISRVGHVTHAYRYLADNGAPIGLEPERVKWQVIWARRDSVDLSNFKGVSFDEYSAANFHLSKPNHNLFGEDAFKDADLVAFKVRTPWEAARVILEVAGSGHTK
jgi:hypothetical protein